MQSVPSTANSQKTPMRSTHTSTFTNERSKSFHISSAGNVKVDVKKKIFQYQLTDPTFPSDELFVKYLDGHISPTRLVSPEIRKKKPILQEKQVIKDPIIIHRNSKNGWESYRKFSSVVDMVSLLKKKVELPEQKVIQKKEEEESPKRQNRLEGLTVEYRELQPALKMGEPRTQRRQLTQQDWQQTLEVMQTHKDRGFIKKCERLQGEKLTKEEYDLILKPNKSEKDLWEITKRFSRRKWFFELIYQKDSHRRGLQAHNMKGQSVWFGKLRELIEKKIQDKSTQREKEPLVTRLEENIKHVSQLVEDRVSKGDLLQTGNKKYFVLTSPRQKSFKQLKIVKDSHQTSQGRSLSVQEVDSKAYARIKLKEAADKYLDEQLSNKQNNLMSDEVYQLQLNQYFNKLDEQQPQKQESAFETLYGFKSERQSPSQRILKKRCRNSAPDIYRIIRRNQPNSFDLSRSGEMQNESFPSVTEVQLNNLYREAKTAQKVFRRELKSKSMDPTKLQHRVKNIIKIGNLQSEILKVTNQKLERKLINS